TRFEVFDGGTLKAGTGLYHQPPQQAQLIGDTFFERAWGSELGCAALLDRQLVRFGQVDSEKPRRRAGVCAGDQ
ncbi:MAG: hypothetical protein ACXW48_24030, partial [Candidatus Binatia bacterium]